MECNTELFKSNSYIISYRGKKLGKTFEAPTLNFTPGLYAAKSSFAGQQKYRDVIATLNIMVTVKIKNIDANRDFIRINEYKGENSILSFSKKILSTGGELCFTPCLINPEGTNNICFPKAVLIPEKHCIDQYKTNEEKYFELTFEVHENFHGILSQEYSI